MTNLFKYLLFLLVATASTAQESNQVSTENKEQISIEERLKRLEQIEHEKKESKNLHTQKEPEKSLNDFNDRPYQDRRYGIFIDLSSTKATYDDNSYADELKLTTSFLFNFERFEIGPVFSTITKSDSSNNSTKGSGFGIYGVFNIIPNKKDEKYVPYVAIEANTGSSNVIKSGSTTSINFSGTYLSVGVKFFPIGNNACFYADYTAGTQNISSSSVSGSGDIRGLGLGIAAYF
ncbi:MAG: hypothetical protein KDD61_14625 [Bdellovibrionales bacterium]|nr:hypothetical protein [Bdellovibrionales bacterium]